MTLPFFLRLETFRVTFPAVQCALRSRAFALASVIPTTLGTTHFGRAKVAVTERPAVIDTVQVPMPEHAPDQPAKVELEAACAESVTEAA